MAKDQNEHFSSVFTNGDISSQPFRKREGDESTQSGPLFVTPEMISNKIKMMKENKSPGVDEISPKLLIL